MKYAFWAFGFILIGLFGLFFILLFQDVTINNEAEYYVLKEAMSASMLESVDFACYRIGEDCKSATDLKMSEQKFVENFTKRFAKSISGTVQNYTIEFYDIMEKPPKATVVVTGKTKRFGILSSKNRDVTFDLTNNLSGILEIENSICEFTDYFFFIEPIDSDSPVKRDKKSSNETYFTYQYLDTYSRSFNIVQERTGVVNLVKENAGEGQMTLYDFYKYYKNTLTHNGCEVGKEFRCSASNMNERFFKHGSWKNLSYPYGSDELNDKNKTDEFILNNEIEKLVNISILPTGLNIEFNLTDSKYCIEDINGGNKLNCFSKDEVEEYKYIETYAKIERFFNNVDFGKGYFLSPALYRVTYNMCE